MAPIDCGLICSSLASALEVAGPLRSRRASAAVSGTVSSPSTRTCRIRRRSRPMLDAQRGGDVPDVGIFGHTLSLN